MPCKPPVGLPELGCTPKGAASTLLLTLNGQQYEPVAPTFAYFDPVTVASVSPACGPVGGATTLTLSVPNLAGAHYLCRFGDGQAGLWPYSSGEGFGLGLGVVPATATAGGDALVCVTPAQPAASTSLEISWNGQQFTNSSTRFLFAVAPTLTSLSPTSGPAAGAALLTISGASLGGGAHYRCRFTTAAAGRVEEPATVSDGGDELRCRTPPLRPAKATVEVSLNAQQFVGALDFTTFTPPRVVALSPTTGPQQAGGTLVRLSGLHFFGDTAWHARPHTRLRCKFGADVVVASFGNGNLLKCYAPGGADAVPWRSVALHGNLPPVSAGGVSKFGFAAGVGGSPQFLTDFERFPAYSSGIPGHDHEFARPPSPPQRMRVPSLALRGPSSGDAPLAHASRAPAAYGGRAYGRGERDCALRRGRLQVTVRCRGTCGRAA